MHPYLEEVAKGYLRPYITELNLSDTDTKSPKIECLVRKKFVKLTPEEAVRQCFILHLHKSYFYPLNQMQVETPIHFGREIKRADIVVYDSDFKELIIVEVKKSTLKEGKEQLRSYCNATGAIIGIWSNAIKHSFYHRRDPNYFEDLSNIPKHNQSLTEILEERWTIKTLKDKDKLFNEKKSLKDLILEMEDEVLANAGVDVFEEVFKLIFTKLYDEMQSTREPSLHLEFRNYGETENQLLNKIQKLFDKAKDKWQGVFNSDSKIALSPSHLSVCISSLQSVKLFNSNLDVVDEAFEYLISETPLAKARSFLTKAPY
ncbi:type I restriction enzyme HsdR N-terminal domain-containing protein [Helicobacter cetorum]|uniref:Type I restriction enzyme R protein N-terminal domain-containing protein n=1 Tax=Helicobacter cetorum (strain ATCC BAA-540 / CCUG 52418 / MIT 99-5656) TaxID=1163745 RepID=I0EUC1_HELCM|nr:type I restriction enzyme HsdR N-terminal domain-containing protein [Helicobacter cetorum]AFI06540.1 hypothetical protein HCD_07765 [Helicobacter cetorum MIT 99-5656]